MPLLGVHDRIQQAREAERTWSDAAIAEARTRVRAQPADAPAARLADLVAYRDLAAGVSSWPLDMPALRRVMLRFVIPLASWVASARVQALAEKLVSVA